MAFQDNAFQNDVIHGTKGFQVIAAASVRVATGYRRRRRWTMRHTVWLGWLLMGRLLG